MDHATGRVAPLQPQDETDIRTQEIREEIAQTRIEMAETIEAIQERLTPSHLVAQAGETVRNAAVEKVNGIATAASYAARRVSRTSLVQTLRANPLPVALVGIGAGAAWLLMQRRTAARRRHLRRASSETTIPSTPCS